ncbi:box c d snorna protein 1-like [Moniliophthora roreri MCA 2997]|uniref:Box c d snorna protein 1-like n=2 Tax=Moniliophthora roreri TaxID=221103 RepID=V2WQS5_MONRO|nr:box c d snorna protein 1-like [Moniliophthora roreri MCA 2997]KAI3596693.1 box c d snorna protein 1-like [Moniliophthora roreri]
MSASTSTTVLCSVCTQNSAKYTCPRCSIRSCSATCSKKHKEEGQGCSGIRDPSVYTPLKKYNYMSLMNDYVYLEEVGRCIKEWGTEIVKGGYQPSHGYQPRSQSSYKKGMRGRGKGAGGSRGGKEKLSAYLATHGIQMELLPVGMERRAKNMSVLRGHPPNQQPLLSLEFKFHQPKTENPSCESCTVLTHNNALSAPLLDLVHNAISHQQKKGKGKEKGILVDWLSEDVYTEDDIVCLIATEAPLPSASTPSHISYPQQLFPFNISASIPVKRKPQAKHFHRLDPTISLLISLSGCQSRFVEFPTIEIFHGEDFDGAIVDPSTGVLEARQHEIARPRPAKKRKLAPRAMSGLLGGYGSDAEEQEEEKEKEKAGLAILDYESSSESAADAVEQSLDMASDDEDEEGDQDISPEVLLQLIQQAAKNDGGDEEELDWGISDEEVL